MSNINFEMQKRNMKLAPMEVNEEDSDEVRTIKPKNKTATSKDIINEIDKQEKPIAERTRITICGDTTSDEATTETD
ncbi:unnamed protein product, partial [Wuchereria bancrofti]